MKTVHPAWSRRWKQSPMPSAVLPQEVTVRPHMPSLSQIQWACYKKWRVEQEAQTGMCRKLLGMCCPGHAGVKGNDWADRLAGKANLTSGLLLGRSEVLRSLRHYLRAQSQGHHSIDHLEERGLERGSISRSSLKGWEKAIVSQTNNGTVSKATLWENSERRGGAHMGFFERIDTILNWIELKHSTGYSVIGQTHFIVEICLVLPVPWRYGGLDVFWLLLIL